MDPVIGIQQNCESYWNLIHENYIKFKEKLLHDSLQFSKDLYQADTGDEFAFDHCWVILRNCGKWKDLPIDHKGKIASAKKNPQKHALSSNPPSSAALVIELDQDKNSKDAYSMTSHSTCPMGTKAAKMA
ncbi:uncharacterized protein MELLADRAFT_114109 [Melampsora larici-populina 98AG31]|uniref:No apical meristem-associated C-terminal domain-containing protein n=1 Tax=Melampsora larici-populina (strain 98AG31 / pathotype 3-4-7) TaxID=747676 RepID=F4SC74_MELLP|nr:uncharacterized protein MELLADRAFT_114109 [Melampsora larici-populina 98AG31]EGF97757.1 hypothetical protein MELLADRAFT_114109 [Melampsora larici-populina 98AG31]